VANAAKLRLRAGDDIDTATKWSRLVAKMIEVSGDRWPLMGGLLLGAEQVTIRGNECRAIYRDRSIRGALLSPSVRNQLRVMASRIGIALVLEVLPEEAFS